MFDKKVASIEAFALLTSLALVNAVPLDRQLAPRATCEDVKGTFTINQLALYPENGDFDFNSCLLYLGSLFNASVAVYDPYKNSTTTLTFPNITHNPEYHLGGVATNPYDNLLSIVVDAGAAFNTGGRDISGTNLLLKYDPTTQKELYRLNLTETTKGAYGGFQDVEFDSRGNVYVVGTFPSSILKVDEKGSTVEVWYKSNATSTTSGFSGLAVTGDILLSNDNAVTPNGRLVRFDLTAAKGAPIPVPLSLPRSISGSDAIYLPPKYNGTILLAAVDARGVEVLRSKDGKWNEAEALGLVSNNVSVAGGGLVPAAVQIGQSIFMLEEFFGDVQPGNRTAFPVVDITAEVDTLAKK